MCYIKNTGQYRQAKKECRMSLVKLQHFLKGRLDGPIGESSEIDSFLAACWSEFEGSRQGGMEPDKLITRMEEVTREAPTLSFTIERNGGTVMGSSRAELQCWSVDLDRKIATLQQSRFRQLPPRQPPWDAKAPAAKVAELIRGGRGDKCLKQYSDGRVLVLIGEIVPADSAAKQTVAGRRRRFRHPSGASRSSSAVRRSIVYAARVDLDSRQHTMPPDC